MHNPLRMHFLSWMMSDGLSHSAHFLRVHMVSLMVNGAEYHA